jgi:AcrR family transcriptional regulator
MAVFRRIAAQAPGVHGRRMATPPKKRTRSKSRHTEILDEAARQFNRKGVSLNALQEIADALGVTRRALYHYVRDREDLVFQCYVRTCATLDSMLTIASAGASGAVNAIERFLDLVIGPGQPELCSLTELGLLRDDQRAHVTALHDRVADRVAALLDAGHAAGEVRKLDTAVIARCIVGVIEWIPVSVQWSTGATRAPLKATLAFTRSYILDGWAADRRGAPDYPVLDLAFASAPKVEGFDREGLAEAKREQILVTASRLFNRKGIDSTSLEEIAGEFGATPRALYHHVGDKAALVAACYLRTLRIAIALQAHPAMRGLSRLQAGAAFQHAWALCLSRPEVSPLMPLAGFETLSAETRSAFMAKAEELTDRALETLDQGMSEGSLRSSLDRRATRLTTGVSGWLTHGALTEPAAQEAAAREIAAFYCLGIRALTP